MRSIAQRMHSRALEHAADQARLAPSVHNTQPWHFRITTDSFEIRADRSRQLEVLDPHGRQLLISCGCAMFNARVALAVHDLGTEVELMPDPHQPDLLARLTVTGERTHDKALGDLDEWIMQRQTNRRRFAEEAVPSEFVDTLIGAASAEETTLIHLTDIADRLTLARLSQYADQQQLADPAYRAELRAWTTSDPKRRDGVPAAAVPHVDAGARDDIPIRDFDTHGMGWLPVETRSSVNQCLLLLCAAGDNPIAWLQVGQALERVLLEITRHGYAASPLTQAIEHPWTRETLQTELGLPLHPDIVLRVGRAPLTGSAPRRPLADLLS